MTTGRFDAAFLAVGARRRPPRLRAGAAPRHGSSTPSRSCTAWKATTRPRIGRRVVVYGGGDTAVDAARTARRLGADPVIVYRRTRDRDPAHDIDVEEALEEGVLDALAVDHSACRRWRG